MVLLLGVYDGHHVPHIQFGIRTEALYFELAVHLVQHGELAVDRLGHDPVVDLLGYEVSVDLHLGTRRMLVEV